jgi:S-DNA-T family DNA segregation ATPase FtsK/SpoIIIE
MNDRIPVPRLPEPSTPHRFPVIATIAPVAVSIALWVVTDSIYALMFAALGPVVAVGSAVDARIQRRRSARREAARFDRDCARVRQAIDVVHAREREDLEARHPSVDALLDQIERDPHRWSEDPTKRIVVRIGVGEVPSSVDFASSPSIEDGPEYQTLAALSASARIVDHAPIIRDAARGMGIVGPERLAESIARAIVVRCAIALSPEQYAVSAPDDDKWAWIDELPHSRTFTSSATTIAFESSDPDARGARRMIVAYAAAAAALPRDLGTIVSVTTGARATLRSVGEAALPGGTDLLAEFVAVEHATALARRLAACAKSEGVRPAREELPDGVEFAAIASAPPREERASSLAGPLGMGVDGVVSVDLATDGPHAIVGGTTGSGKSELLLSWMLGLAMHRCPTEVTFLFVDFKGGASFDPLMGLPHCVGVITDLDVGQSLRALSSLAAELRYRERLLAEQGLRSIDGGEAEQPFPRLLVVVDEYAALVDAHPDLHAVFADIAARGRSLGVHLVLCTQRPAGIVRDSILANSALRISLRVNSAADSRAVIGTDAAAALATKPIGRAYVAVGGEPPELVQVARSTPGDVQSVAHRWREAPRPRRPWLAPLPATIALSSVSLRPANTRVPFCVIDRPEIQSQLIGEYSPETDGSLLVIGAPRSGKTGLIRTLAQSTSTTRMIVVPPTLPGVWDALVGCLSTEHPLDAPRTVLLIDDVDGVLSSSTEEYAHALIELLARVLREGPSAGVQCVITVQRLSGALQNLLSLCSSHILLRTVNRQEHILAGGDSSDFTPDLAPGAGHWKGNRIQVLFADTVAHTNAEPLAAEQSIRMTSGESSAPPLAAVSPFPERTAADLQSGVAGTPIILLRDRVPGSIDLTAAAAGALGVLVGDPDSWQSHWGVLAAIRGRGDILFDGCPLADFRALTRIRELPPPSAKNERPLWVLRADGQLDRVARAGATPGFPRAQRDPTRAQ